MKEAAHQHCSTIWVDRLKGGRSGVQRISRGGERSPRVPADGKRGDLALGTAEPCRPAALGYVTSNGTARLYDSEVIDQVAALESVCARRGWDLAAWVHEASAGQTKRHRRPALAYALGRMRVGDISCLVVTELAGLCPSVSDLRGVLDALERAGARLVSLHPAIDTGTESGHEAVRVLCAISEREKARAAERSRAGLAAARARGAIEPAIEPALRRRIERMRGAGMTLQAIVDELNAAAVPTVRGGAIWRPSSIQAAIGYKRPARA
jgi:DNA invertase Pin-like site-specific DNA recombinase